MSNEKKKKNKGQAKQSDPRPLQQEEEEPAMTLQQVPREIAQLHSLLNLGVDMNLEDLGVALAATKTTPQRFEALCAAVVKAADGVTDARAKRLMHDLIYLSVDELLRKHPANQLTTLPPIVAQVLSKAILFAWLGTETVASRALTHPATRTFAPYAKSFKLGHLLPELGAIADIEVEPHGYDVGQLKDRKRRLGRISPKMMQIVTGLVPLPYVADETLSAIVKDAVRDTMLTILAPQCATDLSTSTNGWAGNGASRIPAGVVEDALVQSVTDEPHLLTMLRNGTWSKYEILDQC